MNYTMMHGSTNIEVLILGRSERESEEVVTESKEAVVNTG